MASIKNLLLAIGTVIMLSSVYYINNKHKTIVSPFKKTDPESIYKRYCADCHGKNLETFVNKKTWLFGNTEGDLFTSIKYGREIVGMPAYGESLKEDEIKAVVNYIKSVKKTTPPEPEEKDLTSSVDQAFDIATVVEKDQYGELLWGMDFLPNGKMLITDKSGKMFLGYPEKKLNEINGMPAHILQLGQGGLMDVMVHPGYEQNRFIYISYTEGLDQNSDKQLVILRASLDEKTATLSHKKEIFRALPLKKTAHHFGSRMAIDKAGYLYITSGERGGNEMAQELSNHFGKIIRLHDDGRIPADNPFVNTDGALPEIYSYGHRNPQGMIIHPVTNQVYVHEHGPKGGDEINLIEPSKNYGWPSILFGINYDGKPISKDTARAGMEQPLLYWLPSIAPCGMTYVDGNKYPGWSGDLLIGSLKFKNLSRCKIDSNGRVKETETLLRGIGRVRSVKMDAEGLLYVMTEKPGAVYRLDPK